MKGFVKVDYKRFICVLLLCVSAFFIRIYKVNEVPNGLNWDEAAYAYNAHSLLQYGEDEWGIRWPLLLRSFGEYKPALISYLLIPVISLGEDFGEWVRVLPVLMSMVGIMYWFLLMRKWTDYNFAFISTLLLSFAPWHIHYSRALLDPIFSLSFMIIGMYYLFERHSMKIFIGGLFLFLSMYTYHSAKIIIPLLLIMFYLVAIKSKSVNTFHRFPLYIPLLLVALSIFLLFFTNAGQRPKDTLFTTNPEVQLTINEGIYRGNQSGLLFPRAFSNKLKEYSFLLSKKYLSHFQFDFLFFNNNLSARHGFEKQGNLPLIILPFLLYGAAIALRRRSSEDTFFLLLILLTPLPASVTTDVPHSGRVLLMLPGLLYLSTVGIFEIYKLVRYRVYYKTALLLAFIISVTWYLFDYHLFFPEASEYDWQGHLKPAVLFAQEEADNFEKILISKNSGGSYIFYALYNNIGQKIVKSAHLDQGNEISHINNVYFVDENICLLNQKNVYALFTQEYFPELLEPDDILYYSNRFHEPKVSFYAYKSSEVLSPLNTYFIEHCSTNMFIK